MKRLLKMIAALAAMLLAFASCSKDQFWEGSKTFKVAVVVPMNENTQEQWRKTVDWAVSNIDEAQLGCGHRVKLEVEMYDEETEDIEALGAKLASRKDIKAVIGPVNQDRLELMAGKIKGAGKPLFAISAGATDIVRKYVEKKNFFWALTQTDISQLEVMLTTAAEMGRRHVSLICNGTSTSSQTFMDWFSFQVTELGLTMDGYDIYYDPSEIEGMMDECFAGGDLTKTAIICVPGNQEEARTMLSIANGYMSRIPYGEHPLLYFSSDIVQTPISDLTIDYNYWTVYPFVDPQGGFYTAFYAHTGSTSITFEAQLYDALMLSAFALAVNPDDVKSSLLQITDVDGDMLRAWSMEGMTQIFEEIEGGGVKHHIAGASSKLQFDVDNHTCVTTSHFMLCYFNDGGYYPISYYSPLGSGSRTSATLSDWNWQVTHVQDIETTGKTFSYPELDKRWAVVVATSSGFDNYRHQADALNVYQYLKSSGYDDDHILFVIADDIANNSKNKHKGEVRIATDGENLYHDLQIDYKLGDLTCQQFLDKIAELPSDSDDNIFVFWSGHGSPSGLVWNGDGRCSRSMVSDLMQRMQGRYRKMMWCIETCYSGLAGEAMTGYPGVIALTAANAYETSKAASYDSDMNIWMSNRFTLYFIETLKVSDLTIREMYYYLAGHTTGSHASLYNFDNYDDVTTADFDEYIPR